MGGTASPPERQVYFQKVGVRRKQEAFGCQTSPKMAILGQERGRNLTFAWIQGIKSFTAINQSIGRGDQLSWGLFIWIS